MTLMQNCVCVCVCVCVCIGAQFGPVIAISEILN